MVQGPANQAQGPADQNQAQGPAAQVQVQVQGQAAQGPANNNAQVGKNVPMQPQQQLAPSTTSPHWSGGACPSGILSKLDRKET